MSAFRTHQMLTMRICGTIGYGRCVAHKSAPPDKCSCVVYSPQRSMVGPTDCYSSGIDIRLIDMYMALHKKFHSYYFVLQMAPLLDCFVFVKRGGV